MYMYIGNVVYIWTNGMMVCGWLMHKNTHTIGQLSVATQVVMGIPTSKVCLWGRFEPMGKDMHYLNKVIR